MFGISIACAKAETDINKMSIYFIIIYNKGAFAAAAVGFKINSENAIIFKQLF